MSSRCISTPSPGNRAIRFRFRPGGVKTIGGCRGSAANPPADRPVGARVLLSMGCSVAAFDGSITA
jgi:hypothetical protein